MLARKAVSELLWKWSPFYLIRLLICIIWLGILIQIDTYFRLALTAYWKFHVWLLQLNSEAWREPATIQLWLMGSCPNYSHMSCVRQSKWSYISVHYYSPDIPFFWVFFAFLGLGAIILARNFLKCFLLFGHDRLRDITSSLIYFNILPHIIEWPSVAINEFISWRGDSGSILSGVTMLQLQSYNYKFSAPDFYLLSHTYS